MIQTGCPNCQKYNFFKEVGEGLYECDACGKKYKKCNEKNCSNMLSFGFYCSKCVGRTLKTGGSLVLTTLALALAGAIAIVKKGKT